MQTTSTVPLASAGASGSLPITAAGVPAGTSALPVYAGAPNAARAGIYIAASNDFIGGWALYRHTSGYQADPAGRPQITITGDNVSLAFSSTGALASLAGMDSVSLVLTAYSAGNLTLSVVQ